MERDGSMTKQTADSLFVLFPTIRVTIKQNRDVFYLWPTIPDRRESGRISDHPTRLIGDR